MPLSEDVQAFETLMERIAVAYKARMMQVCKAGELTPPQFFALFTIARLGRTKMSPLGDELGLSMGAASTLIDRLVTRGLVERDADPADRRAVYVCLSPKGEDVLREAKGGRNAIFAQVLEAMPAPKRQLVLEGLGALAEAWEALPPVGPHGLSCAVEE